MLAHSFTASSVSESVMQSVASELLIKDLVNSSLDSRLLYSKDYSLKKQFEALKQRTQLLIDNLNPIMLSQYKVLLDCFKNADNHLSSYELFNLSYDTYRSMVSRDSFISMECAAYLYFLYR